MNNRENALAVLRFEDYERVPLVHFGFWPETIEKWHKEGHLSDAEVEGWDYGSPAEERVASKLGFDFGWGHAVTSKTELFPSFERRVLEAFADGSRKVANEQGVVILEKEGVVSIPMEIDHLFKGRAEWDGQFRDRLLFSPERVDLEGIGRARRGEIPDMPLGLYCGSLFGQIRNMLGVEGSAYLYADDEELFREVIDAVGELCYRTTEATLAAAPDLSFDFAHFWEDICFKNGPLVIPSVFDELVGPHYERITRLLASRGVGIVTLDCDGCIDSLLPTWVNNGVNAMFPIEVGTWEASIEPWRERFGRKVLGVGGMNKTVFSRDRAAVDGEIGRLERLVALGGYLPCPDHRIPPDAEYDNVRYYCDRFRSVFG